MNKIKFYLPDKDYKGDSISAAIVSDTIQEVCKLSGGATAYNAKGYWINQRGVLLQEDTTILDVVTDSISRNQALQIMERFKEAANQESVLIEYNGEPLFI